MFRCPKCVGQHCSIHFGESKGRDIWVIACKKCNTVWDVGFVGEPVSLPEFVKQQLEEMPIAVNDDGTLLPSIGSVGVDEISPIHNN